MSARINTDAIKSAQPPETVLGRLGVPYKRKGRRFFTPCPGCGKNKFDIHAETGVFNCFVCDVAGGDVIALVQVVRNCGFVAACEFLSDDLKALSQKDLLSLEARQKKIAAAAEKEKAAKNARDLGRMMDIRSACQPVMGTLAEGYLISRGLGPMIAALGWEDHPPADILFHPGLPAKIEGDGAAADRWIDAGGWPAMIAIGRAHDGHPVVMHRSFITQDGNRVRKVRAEDLPDNVPDDLRHRWRAKQMIGSISACDAGVFLGQTNDVTNNPNAFSFVGEGLESSGAAAAAGCSGLFYAGLSLNRLVGTQSGSGFTFPDDGRLRVVLADNDLSPVPEFGDDPHNEDVSDWGPHKFGGVRRAKSLFTRAAKRLARGGDDVAIFIPPYGQDPNDLLIQGAPS